MYDTGQPPAEDIETDWLNIFERCAEDASSEKLQDIWGRILAGEIRKPRSFSLRTLRFVSELDQRTATLFTKYGDAVIDGEFIPQKNVLEGTLLTELLELEQAGLLSGVGGNLGINFVIAANGTFLKYSDHALRVMGTTGEKFRIPAVTLSQVAESWSLSCDRSSMIKGPSRLSNCSTNQRSR